MLDLQEGEDIRTSLPARNPRSLARQATWRRRAAQVFMP